MGSPSKQPYLIAMELPDASSWGVINFGATAPIAAKVSGVLFMAQSESP
jgi:hypothetical protein